MFKGFTGDLSAKKVGLYFLILIIAATITYSNHFKNAFHFDDSHTIEENLYIRDIKNIPLFFKDGTTFSSLPSNQSYRPVVSTTLAIDYWLGDGFNLFYFHLSSFILFLLQGLLMFLVVYKLSEGIRDNIWRFAIAAFATTWYTLHPANAETVNYIIARSDLQSTFFVVLAFVMYIYSAFCRKTFLYLIPVAIGTLAKPTSVMFAPMLFFYILFFEQKMSLRDLFRKTSIKKMLPILKTIVPVFLVCGLVYWWVDHKTPHTWISGGFSRYHYLITQPYVILHYFLTLFFPFWLSADTDLQAFEGIGNPKFFLGIFFILSLVIIAFRTSKSERLRPISFGIIWFLLALIPTSSIIPFAEVMNDHRVFFPYIGLVLSAVYGLALLLKKSEEPAKPLKNRETAQAGSSKQYFLNIAAVSVLLLVLYAQGVYKRNQVWLTEESLWLDVSKKSPKNGRGLMNYGLTQMAKGDYDTAEKYFNNALKLLPAYYSLYINLAILKNAKGDKAAAEKDFKTALQFGNDYPDSWFYYGRFLASEHREDEAIPYLVKTIELAPAHTNARSLLMKVYSETGNWEKLKDLAENTLKVQPGNTEATAFLRMATNQKGDLEILENEVKKNPTPEKYLDLSLKYYQQGNYQNCIRTANEALKLKPGYLEAYNNIASAYNALGDYDKAMEACKKALEINPHYQLAINNMDLIIKNKNAKAFGNFISKKNGNAEDHLNNSLQYYNKGEYQKCIEECQKALAVNPNYAEAYSNMCAAYNQLKMWNKAVEMCQKALSLNPGLKIAEGNLKWAKDQKK